MSELDKTPKHKYAVGAKFEFDGTVEIIGLRGYNPVSKECMYLVKMQDGSQQELTETWLDAGVDHYSQYPYSVTCIVSAPEELKVGDRVEVVDAPELFVFNIGRTGVIKSFDKDGNAYISVKDDDPGTITAQPKYLRKLPDTISFEENPLEMQVGGNHYKDMAIQPIEFSMKNGLNACQHSILKYVCRYKHKNGKEDLLKARHFIDLLIQLEYPE